MQRALAAIFAFAALAAPAAAAGLPYTASVELEQLESGAQELQIRFQTVQIFSSMCGRKTVDLQLGAPKKPQGLGIPAPAIGRIAMKTALQPGTICLAAFGPHRGGVSLAVGDHLPALAPGCYALDIDGQAYGFVALTEDGATLVDHNEIPQ